MKYEREIEAAQTVLRAVNVMGFNARVFAQEVMREHRTIQQNLFRVVGMLIDEWAGAHENNTYDPRNEYTVKRCREIKETVGTIWPPFI